MNLWWLGAGLLALLGAGALVVASLPRYDRRLERRFAAALGGGEEALQLFPGHEAGLLGQLARRGLTPFGEDRERFDRLLTQCGWRGPRARLVAWLLMAPLPVVAAFVAMVLALAEGEGPANVFAAALFAFALCFVAPRRILARLAARRQQAMRREVVPFIYMLRMLLDAGLSLEHALNVIVEQGRAQIPTLAPELEFALRRIQAGDERADALGMMAAPLEVPELGDTVAMLRQVSRYGGNIRDSLANYARVVEERHIDRLREYVSKLSAKMTVVMVTCLFPALLIFVAGPGFVGLAKALRGGIGG